jgi:hypothetical protein
MIDIRFRQVIMHSIKNYQTDMPLDFTDLIVYILS